MCHLEYHIILNGLTEINVSYRLALDIVVKIFHIMVTTIHFFICFCFVFFSFCSVWLVVLETGAAALVPVFAVQQV